MFKRLWWAGSRSKFTAVDWRGDESQRYVPTQVKVFGVESEDFGGAWSKQELFKGCALWYGVNAATFSGAEIEGGWGINARYVANPLASIPLSGFNAFHFRNYTREDLVTSPLFTTFEDGRMASTNALDFADAELRAKMLGDAIPAESFAAGRNVLDGFEMACYLTPTSLDRNLEWDMKTNLCPDPGNLGERRP